MFAVLRLSVALAISSKVRALVLGLGFASCQGEITSPAGAEAGPDLPAQSGGSSEHPQTSGCSGAAGCGGAASASAAGAAHASGAGGALTGSGAASAAMAGSAAGGAPAAGVGGAAVSGSGSGGSHTAGSGGAHASGGAPATGLVSYATDFGLTESPISEGNVWHREGLAWTSIATSGGVAYGTQAIGPRSDADHYNDSYAYLQGFPPNQRARAIIAKTGSMDPSCSHEVELLLRWSDAAGEIHGYECNIAHNGSYTEIVRLDGARGSWAYISQVSSVTAPQTGDEFGAEIIGNRINVYLNGKQINSADVTSIGGSVFGTGNPGIGLYRGPSGCGSLGDYGFTSYAASSIDP
jgi:hypothetical protein